MLQCDTILYSITSEVKHVRLWTHKRHQHPWENSRPWTFLKGNYNYLYHFKCVDEGGGGGGGGGGDMKLWNTHPSLWRSLIRILRKVVPVAILDGMQVTPGQRQAITRTNANLLSIGPLGTNFPCCPGETSSGTCIATLIILLIGEKLSHHSFRWWACCLTSTKPLSKPMLEYC